MRFICFFYVIWFLGCSENPTKVARQNIEEHLMSQMNDPYSYKFVSMTELDTVYKVPYYKQRVLDYGKFVKRIELALERKKEELKAALSNPLKEKQQSMR